MNVKLRAGLFLDYCHTPAPPLETCAARMSQQSDVGTGKSWGLPHVGLLKSISPVTPVI